MEERIWRKSYPEGVAVSIDYEKLTLPETLKRTGREISRYGGPDHDGEEDHLPGTG